MFESSPNSISLKREFIFLVFAGLFLSSMTLLNILGTSKLIDLGFGLGDFKMTMPVGVIAYPITFLCTDFISELYGKKRANALVWIGLIVNLWVLLIMYIGGLLPELELPNSDYSAFYTVRKIALGSIVGSMAAYFLAQFIDVQIFHYLKKKTNGKMLWLRNNASTLVSQLVDTIVVMLIVHYLADGFGLKKESSDIVFQTLFNLIVSSYLFKFVIALIDTIPFYLGVKGLKRYLEF